MTINIDKKLSDTTDNNNVGRPALEFANCSERTKQKRSSALNAQEGLQAIEHAYVQGLRTSRRKPVADLVATVSAVSPKRMKRISESLTETGEVPLTVEEALALILDMDLSKHGYEILCRVAKKHNSKLFPPYDQLKSTKTENIRQKNVGQSQQLVLAFHCSI
jgi:hypothetical protein